jgi:hypothetical protein
VSSLWPGGGSIAPEKFGTDNEPGVRFHRELAFSKIGDDLTP